jgi:dihydroorotate dehydrogenase
MMFQSQGRLLRPWLWLPSQLSHDISPYVLPLIARTSTQFDKNWRSLNFKNLFFANPLGIAGGVDKSGACLNAWSQLGAGFVEVGTVTPKPQQANPGKIMARDIKNQALWNKMGFPNAGASALVEQLKKNDNRKTPLFVNIGKNRETKNDLAYLDYAHCVYELNEHADAFVINISSPNTQGLRDLLTEQELRIFLDSLFNKISNIQSKKLFLLKLSPDMDMDTLSMVFEISQPFVNGWILTNTTKSRFVGSHFPKDVGGVSGYPLKEISKDALKIALKYKTKDKLIVSVGGIDNEAEILERINMGADLVQFYSALVFNGPFFFQKKIKGLRSIKAY